MNHSHHNPTHFLIRQYPKLIAAPYPDPTSHDINTIPKPGRPLIQAARPIENHPSILIPAMSITMPHSAPVSPLSSPVPPPLAVYQNIRPLTT
jgi:hypothetical protein